MKVFKKIIIILDGLRSCKQNYHQLKLAPTITPVWKKIPDFFARMKMGFVLHRPMEVSCGQLGFV
jgi:hypothetical protein